KLSTEFVAFTFPWCPMACRPVVVEAPWRRRKYHDLVRASAAHQARAVCFAEPFAKNFSFTPDQTFENPAIRFVHNFEQIVIPLFFNEFVDLVRYVRRRSAAPQ